MNWTPNQACESTFWQIQHERTFVSILQAAREALGWMYHQNKLGAEGVEAGWRGDLDDVYPGIKHRCEISADTLGLIFCMSFFLLVMSYKLFLWKQGFSRLCLLFSWLPDKLLNGSYACHSKTAYSGRDRLKLHCDALSLLFNELGSFFLQQNPLKSIIFCLSFLPLSIFPSLANQTLVQEIRGELSRVGVK